MPANRKKNGNNSELADRNIETDLSAGEKKKVLRIVSEYKVNGSNVWITVTDRRHLIGAKNGGDTVRSNTGSQHRLLSIYQY